MEMTKKKPFALTIILVVFMAASVFSACGKGNSGAATASRRDEKFVFQGKPTAAVTFLSTQMNPVEEAGKMRNSILKDYPGAVEFKPNDSSFLSGQIDSVLSHNPSASVLIGALHGDLVTLHEQNALLPVTDIFNALEKRAFSGKLLNLSRLDGTDMYYIPWMQASFVMVANKKALAFLPPGAKIGELTYEQLAVWANSIFEKTGIRPMGFPAGAKGLMHRFFQGYLYPSFTGSTLLKFRSGDAEKMWEFFRDFWQYVHPGSLVYSTMAEPLLAGDILIAWDHTARLVKVFEERGEDFIAFPSPVGPKGRGFMPVLSGLAIPRNGTDTKNPALLMDYLTRSEIQNRTLLETGFFPVVGSDTDVELTAALRELSAAVDAQAGDEKSIPTLLPIGLGESGGDFNNYYLLTFSEIVLEGKPIRAILDENAAELQKIMSAENAKCWLPDISDKRPCQIE